MSARGSELETLLNQVHQLYRNQGRAIIDKIEVPRLPDGRPRTKSTVDYTGCLKGGRFVAIEAKMVSKGKRFDFSKVQPHQLQYLQTVKRAGGLAIVLMWLKESDIGYLLDPDEMHADIEAGRKSRNAYYAREQILGFPDYLDQLEAL